MKNIILFDDDTRDHLLPLTYTKPVGELRCGILTIREKWEYWLGGKASYITQDYLAEKYPMHLEDDNLVINGGVMPNDRLARLVRELDFNEALLHGDDLVATRLKAEQFDHLMKEEQIDSLTGFELKETPVDRIQKPWHIFKSNGIQVERDYEIITSGKRSAQLSPTNQLLGNRIFIEEGAKAAFSIFNTSSGPIYLGAGSQVMEGCMIRGPFALGDGAVVKMGAKIYGPTTIGPHSKAGGEINNCVIQGYSNKGHDGFIGNSVLGEWCNLGADTNTSNLKNNYTNVKLWNYPSARFEDSGEQFCGLIMGDHSKTGINTMLNTGTVIGVSCNIYGSGYPRNFIPSFSWGGSSSLREYKLDKALETAKLVMKRRNLEMSDIESRILGKVFELSSEYRPT